MPRLQMKLSRPTVVAMQEYKQIKFGSSTAKVTSGYLIGSAYNSIKINIDEIDWVSINFGEIPNVSNNNDDSLKSLQTTVNINALVLTDIEQLQKNLMTVFETKRMFKPFVIKLIFFAAILKENNKLLFKEDDE